MTTTGYTRRTSIAVKFYISLLLVSMVPMSIIAQVQPTTFSLVAKEPELPFQYEPVNPEFWIQVEEHIQNENWGALIREGADVLKQKGSESEEGAEGRLAIGIGLQGLRISFGSLEIYKSLVLKFTGSQIAQESLRRIDQLVQTYEVDLEDLSEDFLTNNEFGSLHQDIQGFVSYHMAIYNLAHGFTKWAGFEEKKIQPESFWDFKLLYLTAIGEVARDRVNSALEKLETVINSPKVPKKIKTLSNFQKARLLFEKAEMDKAYQIYTDLKELPVRERGRVILERAWAKYYMRDYSKALGLLEGLNAPFFEPSANPEQYILKMLIYKHLCHYDSVEKTAQQFHSKYDATLRLIRKRKPLVQSKILAQRAFMNGKLQSQANFVAQLRDEMEVLRNYDMREFDFYKELIDSYHNRDQEIQTRMTLQLEDKAREAAEELLDAEEQVAFLDYTSKLDSLRIRQKGERREYQSDSVSYFRFDKIFWPVGSEYWLDELENFQVLIRSRCGDPADPPKEDDLDLEGDSLLDEFK